jgi:hypothetical protein
VPRSAGWRFGNGKTLRESSLPALVRHLVTFEASQNQDGLIAASLRVSHKLGSHLSRIIGREGLHTLVVRAVKLTARQMPTMNGVEVTEDGLLFLPDGVRNLDAAGVESLLEQTFGLLISFIGEDLTLRIVQESWPELHTYTAEETETESI